jgi:class 3 adenylate cyclase
MSVPKVSRGLLAGSGLGVASRAGVRGGPPSGVVTFLFTDIEGSTRRWEVDADEMRAELAAHDEVLRAAIEAHGAGYSNTPATGYAPHSRHQHRRRMRR